MSNMLVQLQRDGRGTADRVRLEMFMTPDLVDLMATALICFPFFAVLEVSVQCAQLLPACSNLSMNLGAAAEK